MDPKKVRLHRNLKYPAAGGARYVEEAKQEETEAHVTAQLLLLQQEQLRQKRELTEAKAEALRQLQAIKQTQTIEKEQASEQRQKRMRSMPANRSTYQDSYAHPYHQHVTATWHARQQQRLPPPPKGKGPT